MERYSSEEIEVFQEILVLKNTITNTITRIGSIAE